MTNEEVKQVKRGAVLLRRVVTSTAKQTELKGVARVRCGCLLAVLPVAAGE